MFRSSTTTLKKNDEMFAPVIPTRSSLHSEPLDILLVEDVVSDALLARIALDATKVPYMLRTLHSGNQVLPNLVHQRRSENHKMPDLIMLDLGLPVMDGFEILAALAASSTAINSVPIVILTANKHFAYLQKAYDLWIAAYIQKPCNAEKMNDVIMRIRQGRQDALLH